MDVATISMPAAEAVVKLKEYREGLVGREPTDEDLGVVAGYQAMAKGRRLLDLHAVFRACPRDAKGRPALAVGRAHWRQAALRLRNDGAAEFRQWWPGGVNGWSDKAAWHRKLRLPVGTMPEELRPRMFHSSVVTAIVPSIPPNLRPRAALHRYVILWDADWEEAPVDPLLLRQVHGSLYAVFACWDLTPLERAVLSGRLLESRFPERR